MHTQHLLYAGLALALARLLYLLTTSLLSPLRSVPGPFLARFTKAWYFTSIYRGHHERDLTSLHRQHAPRGQSFAPVIRLGPNLYSLAAPQKRVYAIQSTMPKSAWYNGLKHPSPARWTLFTDRCIPTHARHRRLYAGLYALSALVSYEGYVDQCVDLFVVRLRERATTTAAVRGEALDMAHWFQCFAFDVVGMITYGKRFGFLDEGRDVGSTMEALDRSLVYSVLVGVYPWAHPFLYRLLERVPRTGAAGRAYIMRFAGGILAQRKAQREKGGEGEGRKEDQPEDFVDKMLEMQRGKSEVTDYHVLALTLSNIIAGSDTLALSLSAVLYHLLRTPEAMKTLRAEMETFVAEGRCSGDGVSFKVSQEMQYLQACIKEGMRLHPGVGLPLWRVVDGNGADLCGRFFPPGTEVGVNPWITQYDEDVWGKDAAVFRPERWLEANGERLKDMETHWIPFGMGARTCLGRHIALLEMRKLLPRILWALNFELENPERRWKTRNTWFVKPMDFKVRVSTRHGS